MMSDLAAFLRARRAALRPSDVGLDGGPDRRATGLRRAELADLAHVSLSYYVRLEQGRVGQVSDRVLQSLADALRLDRRDRALLLDIAHVHHGPPQPAGAGRSTVDDGPVSRHLLRHVTESPSPTWLVDHRGDVLAWSRSYHRVFAAGLDYAGPRRPTDRPNVVRTHFLDPVQRVLHLDWERVAAVVVRELWEGAGRHGEDRALAAMLHELTHASPSFARLWPRAAGPAPTPGPVGIWHPTLGTVAMWPLVFRVDDGHDLKLWTGVWDRAEPVDVRRSAQRSTGFPS